MQRGPQTCDMRRNYCTADKYLGLGGWPTNSDVIDNQQRIWSRADSRTLLGPGGGGEGAGTCFCKLRTVKSGSERQRRAPTQVDDTVIDVLNQVIIAGH